MEFGGKFADAADSSRRNPSGRRWALCMGLAFLTFLTGRWYVTESEPIPTSAGEEVAKLSFQTEGP